MIVDRVGRNDIYGLLRAFGMDAMTTHATWIREKLFDQAKTLWAETGPRHSGTGRRLTVVTDLDGLTLSAVSSMDVLYFLEVRARSPAQPPLSLPSPEGRNGAKPHWSSSSQTAATSSETSGRFTFGKSVARVGSVTGCSASMAGAGHDGTGPGQLSGVSKAAHRHQCVPRPVPGVKRFAQQPTPCRMRQRYCTSRLPFERLPTSLTGVIVVMWHIVRRRAVGVSHGVEHGEAVL